jgi:hypothetical protein
MFTLGVPTLNVLNNAISNVANGMPLKDLTSDNSSSFSLGRMQYSRSLDTLSNSEQKLQKKWTGSRESSDVIQRKKRNAFGVNTISAPLSFTDSDNNNTVHQALSRTRNRGGGIPKIVTGSTNIYR